MKIAHFVNPWLPITQNWIYNQILYNALCDHIILCRTLVNEKQFHLDKIFAAYPKNNLFSITGMTIARLSARYPSGYFQSIVKKEMPNILHGHFAWESWRNIALVKKVNLPLITTFYGLDVNKHPQKAHWIKRYEELFKLGAMFIVEGSFMGTSLEMLGCPKEKIRIIHLGVDIDRLTLCSKEKSSKIFNILFVGLEREKKGGIYAAEAFARAAKNNNDIHLHILGDGQYRKKVEKILVQSGVLNKTTFHGYLPVNKYHELLGAMNCIIAPSIIAQDGDTEGGAPVSIIEAQAIGIPVIGTTHCDIPDVVVHQKTGLLSPEKNIEQITSNLLLLINDKQMQEQFSIAAREHVKQNHDIKKQAGKLYNLYKEVSGT